MQNLHFLKLKTALYAEDDEITRTQITKILKMLFNQVYVASDGEEALRLYEEKHPDIIITDIKMPRCDGLSLITKIRKYNYHIPVILMSSYAEQDMLLNAVNLSIDAYLFKPIQFEKFTLALSQAFKRLPKEEVLLTLDQNIHYNTSTKELYRDGKTVILGAKEYDLLNLLIARCNKTVTYDEIIQTIWPFDPISDSTLKNTILRLRKKIDSDIIISVRGSGYRIDTVKK
ncbi:response regulator transcription factor [Sulfuricurvum sp.]|uniref:response regulator transcription factor n=1 Tax=Sulfuricurvum sp. TaxID=2025608 RepID=UPI002E38187D|nr:response regulator transcription factor [Sulfuricurvum sp.]HEX5329668.1 response regulator transcription factor [Sulfuricurvum sp.]